MQAAIIAGCCFFFILIENLGNQKVSATKHVAAGKEKKVVKTKKVFTWLPIIFQMPVTYGFYVKLLGLSEVEMLEVLNNIKTEQLDTSAGGTLIQDYKERRFLSLFQYLSLDTSGCV